MGRFPKVKTSFGFYILYVSGPNTVCNLDERVTIKYRKTTISTPNSLNMFLQVHRLICRNTQWLTFLLIPEGLAVTDGDV